MDTEDLILKLNEILANTRGEANELVRNSTLSMNDRFIASRTLECALLRSQLTDFVSDLRALD